jgi:low affinity Fe/Cu permease
MQENIYLCAQRTPIIMVRNLLVILLLFPLSVFAQTDVQQVTSNSFSDAQGIVYKLPKTKLVITAQAEHRISKAGPFCLYAERYLGVKDAIAADCERWTLTSAAIHSQGEPDNNKIFKIIDAANSNMEIQLTADGIIAAINQQIAVDSSATTPFSELPRMTIVASTSDLTFNMAVLGQDALLAGSTAKMAEMASQQIYSIRENRNDILTGEADNIPSGEAMQVLLAEMDRNERELLELFIGKTTTDSVSQSFDIVPEKDINSECLFRFSSVRGFTDKEDLSGTPAYINLKAERQRLDPTLKENKKRSGIVYNIPGKAQVEILFDGQTLSQGEFMMGQFGVEQSLVPKLFNNKTAPSLIFDTKTGAMTQMQKQ